MLPGRTNLLLPRRLCRNLIWKTEKANFWVWQPIQTPEVPPIHNADWVNNDIDYFILSQLEQAHIKPSRDAERTAVLRRLYFDLIGLPPTADEVKAFIQNKNPQATEHVVDQLLESPHFGERWGRHWLDIVPLRRISRA